ncbi:TRAP transporter small permease [uncultured Nitratireductor sp.]|uniref:TRAP transporter small permease n=1 Tax=uncultured Nitratireductor sp. TaxID=520953 RepID=UPI0025D13E7A|nr:TRAP transporter small permease [uncultured Nitratireductor sp.]
MRSLIDIVGRLNRVISNLGVAIACVFLTTMTAAVILQVISREMRMPIGWTEEIALASMVWVSFLIGPWAYRHHQFTRIDVLVEAMPVRPRTFFNVLIHLLEAGLLIGAIYYSWLFFSGGNSLLPQTTRLVRALAEPLLGSEAAGSVVIKNKYVYAILPIGFAGLLMISIEHILKSAQAFVSGKEDIRSFDLDGIARLPESESRPEDTEDMRGRD